MVTSEFHVYPSRIGSIVTGYLPGEDSGFSFFFWGGGGGGGGQGSRARLTLQSTLPKSNLLGLKK